MDPLQIRFDEFIRRQGLVSSGDKVLLAVSGGRDSVALVKLARNSGIRFGIAHVNHLLRGKESDEDATFVKSMAARIKVPYHLLEADTREYCKRHRLTLQEGARDLRYSWLQKTMKESGYDSIATAHHLNDSIESFFINLLRGTGIHGLCGIPVRNGSVIRPLLFAAREEIDDFTRNNRLKYREDSSNLKDDYLRNRIRHHLIPLLTKLQPSLTGIMEGNLNRFRMARELYDAQLKAQHRKTVRTSPEGKVIPLEPLLEFRQPAELLRELLRLEGFNTHEPEKLLVTGKSGKQFHDTGADTEVVRDRHSIILRKKSRVQDQPCLLEEGMKQLETAGGKLRAGSRKYQTGSEKKTSPGTLMLDAATMTFPLEIRRWIPGDRFRPLGMKQHKKVSDFLTDLKLSVAAKERTWVAVSSGRIICILGLRISDEVKVTEKTRNVLLLRWQP